VFTHLHVHSTYSLLDSAATIPNLIEAAKMHQMTALALTDRVNMYGAIEFYTRAKEAGLQPILGCELQIVPAYAAKPTVTPYSVVVLAETYEGYQNMLRIVSKSQLSARYGVPQVTLDDLLASLQGCLLLTGGRTGAIATCLLRSDVQQAQNWLRRVVDTLGPRQVYIQLEDLGTLEDKLWVREAAKLAQKMGIQTVATNNVRYISRNDAFVYDVVCSIRTGQPLPQDGTHVLGSDQAYWKSAKEMADLFAWIPSAVQATEEIRERCQGFSLPLGRILLPKFPVPNGMQSIEYLRQLCLEGARQRYQQLSADILQRLTYELDTIQSMGFADYFLIVHDFMKFAHDNGIATGPGRGSAAGSLVSYVLRITDVDPLKHGLLFQRFLNPERITMPDIDIDFDYERRHEVIQYVVKRYGQDKVAQIITFGTLAARAAVRDIGRVLKIPQFTIDRVAKLIPGSIGMTIEQALRNEPQLQQLYQTDSAVRNMVDIAMRVEGFPRHTSTHAAGVVIAGEPLTDYTPVQTGAEAGILTQYDMDSIEKVGLLKMDFLGLRTLSVIRNTLEWVYRNTGVQIKEDEIPETDARTFALLGHGDTDGCFQLESFGVKNVLRDLQPNRLEDLIAVISLYRPGPMENIPAFIEAKHGRKPIEYPHPSLEPILKDTYGIIVYQEQIMQIASLMAGFSLGEADVLRRAVGKKKRDVLDEQRQRFVEGCLRQGYDAATANTVYDLIVRFADYGFNRSHAAAYAVLAYRTAYLKANFPKEFMAAMLTSVFQSQTKISQYIDDCRQRGIRILPPDINRSEHVFTPEPDGIRIALSAIKNIGTHTIDAILETRKNRPFQSLHDFVLRMEPRHANKRILEALIASGAMDPIIPTRRAAMGILDDLLEAVQKRTYRRKKGQMDLFSVLPDGPQASLPDSDVSSLMREIPYLHDREYTMLERLSMEHETTGLYISGHPLDPYHHQLAQHATHRICDLPSYRNQQVQIGGRILNVKFVMTKKGQKMAFFQLEDKTGQTECIVFPEQTKRFQDLLKRDVVCICRGTVQGNPEEDGKVMVAALEPIPDRADSRDSDLPMILYLKIEPEREPLLSNVKEVLQRHPGSIPVILVYGSNRRTVALSDAFRVDVTDSCNRQLQMLLGAENVKLAPAPRH
jgi:DNA polymerase-3 subunit alpha